jgi:hypothetical protein
MNIIQRLGFLFGRECSEKISKRIFMMLAVYNNLYQLILRPALRLCTVHIKVLNLFGLNFLLVVNINFCRASVIFVLVHYIV